MLITLGVDVFSFKTMDSSYTANMKMHYVKTIWRRKEKYSGKN